MSALHTLQASNNRLQANINKLQRRVTNEHVQFRREKHALESSLKAQQNHNAKINEAMRQQNIKSKESIGQLKTSFKDTQSNLQKQYQKQQDGFNEKLKQQSESFTKKLMLQEKDFNLSLKNKSDGLRLHIEAEAEQRQKMIHDLRDYTDNHLSEMRTEYTEISKRQQYEINEVKTNVHRIFDQQNKSAELAIDSLNDLDTYTYSLLNDQGRLTKSDYERFKPGTLSSITSRIESARRMLESNNPQAAIAQVEAIHNSLIDLEFEVMQQKNMFDNEYALTILAYEYLMESARQNEVIAIESDVELRLDEWTNGKYRAILDKINNIKLNVEEGYRELTFKDLESLQKDKDTLSNELKEVINEGINRVLSSQQRKDMAVRIAQVLQGYHFEPEIAGYDKRDEKESYMVSTARTADNTKVTVTIIPNETTFENTIAINTDQPNYLRTLDADHRTNAIISSLQEANIEVGNKQSLPEHEAAMMNCYDSIEGRGIPRSVLERVKSISRNAS